MARYDIYAMPLSFTLTGISRRHSYNIFRYQYTGPTGGASGPAPVISDWIPAVGIPITRNGTIGFTVTGADGATLQAEYPDGSVETIYKAGSFTARYINSTVVGGVYVLRRTNGWYATPAILIVAYAGSVNT